VVEISRSATVRAWRWLRARPFPFAVLVVLASLGAALYGPFLDNPKIFDDLALFSSRGLATLATTPFNLTPRTFPYFTIASIEVLAEENALRANRIFALMLHVLVAWSLFLVIRRLLVTAEGPNPSTRIQQRAPWVAAAMAAIFLVHPVSVYAAGYLVQRTIVMATLFSLLSIYALDRAHGERSTRWLAFAILAYSMAVMSKEHAIMIAPAAAFGLWALRREEIGVLKRSAIYLVGCAPAAVLAVLAVRGLIGQTYEPFAQEVLAQIEGIPLTETALGRAWVSANIQMGLFWKYLALWFWPDTRLMSIDMRVDFAALWTTLGVIIRPVAFLAVGLVSVALLVSRRRQWRMVALGIFLAWLSFTTELTSVRFQEPFVLYREYVWATALLVAFASGLVTLPGIAMSALTLVVVLAGFGLARDRLESMQTDAMLWGDAAKLISVDRTPGAARVLFNRGLAFAREKRYDKAADDFNRVLSAAPSDYRGHFGTGIVLFSTGDPVGALEAFDRTIARRREIPEPRLLRAATLERLGRLDDAIAAYRVLAQEGHWSARIRLDQLQQGKN
jgi:protein O-mannosyl-transferase